MHFVYKPPHVSAWSRADLAIKTRHRRFYEVDFFGGFLKIFDSEQKKADEDDLVGLIWLEVWVQAASAF